MHLPHLRSLMSDYFHQDYDLNGDDDTAILVSFAESSWPADVDRTIADIDHLLTYGKTGLLREFTAAVGPTDYIVAENDEDLLQWLTSARTTLATHRKNSG
jgi:hypothetical protein